MNNNKDNFLVNNILMLGKNFCTQIEIPKGETKFYAVHEFVSFKKALKVIKEKNAISRLSVIEDLTKKTCILFIYFYFY